MNIIEWFVHFVLHMDTVLPQIVQDMGMWSYLILWVVIFIETGLVVTPFLPGDSLLFAAGAVAALGGLEVIPLYLLMAVAAVLGDTANYSIGHFVGEKAYNSRFIKKEYLLKTQAFFKKHGGKTILLARFVPIVRTFAPFVAGVGKMRYGYFISYNIFGGILWTALFVFAGYFFGSVEFIKNNFSLVIIAIIVISVIPAVVEVIRNRKNPTPTSNAE